MFMDANSQIFYILIHELISPCPFVVSIVNNDRGNNLWIHPESILNNDVNLSYIS